MCILRYYCADRREATLSTAAKCERGGEERSLWANYQGKVYSIIQYWSQEERRLQRHGATPVAVQSSTKQVSGVSKYYIVEPEQKQRQQAEELRLRFNPFSPPELRGVERVTRSKKRL